MLPEQFRDADDLPGENVKHGGPVPRVAKGKTLCIITEKTAKIHWNFDGWATANDMETRDAGFGCWSGDLPSHQLQVGAGIVTTFLCQKDGRGKIIKW